MPPCYPHYKHTLTGGQETFSEYSISGIIWYKNDMKTIQLNGNTYIQPVPECNGAWYYAHSSDGDLYEAQEIFEQCGHIEGDELFLIHAPEGTVYQVCQKQENRACGEPVGHEGKISFITVEFARDLIGIHVFDCADHTCAVTGSLALSSIKDCYNLRLHEHPLTLSRQDHSNTFDIVWPVRHTIAIGPHESFFHREENRLYFGTWYEDPEYRTEVIVRDISDGQIIERYPGDIEVMPDGQLWYFPGKETQDS